MLSTFLGYGSFLLLGWLVLKPKDRHKPCLSTSVYWTMLSLAAWCALFGRRPHQWAKTPHKRAGAL